MTHPVLPFMVVSIKCSLKYELGFSTCNCNVSRQKQQLIKNFVEQKYYKNSEIFLESLNHSFIPLAGFFDYLLMFWLHRHLLAKKALNSKQSAKGHEIIIWEILRRSGNFRVFLNMKNMVWFEFFFSFTAIISVLFSAAMLIQICI